MQPNARICYILLEIVGKKTSSPQYTFSISNQGLFKHWYLDKFELRPYNK